MKKVFGFLRIKARDLGVFYKIFYSIITIVILINIAVSISSYIYFRRTFENQVTRNVQQLVSLVNKDFEKNLKQIDDIILTMYADRKTIENNGITMKSIISSKVFENKVEQFYSLQIFSNLFSQLFILKDDFESMYIYLSEEKNFSYSVNGTLKRDYQPVNEKWYQETIKADGQTLIYPPHESFHLNGSKEVITFTKLLKNIDKIGGEPYGIILIDLSVDAISNSIKSIGLPDYNGVVLLDGDNQIIYLHNTMISQSVLQEYVDGRSFDGQYDKYLGNISKDEFMVTYNESSITGWKLLVMTPYEEINRNGRLMIRFQLIITLIAIGLAAFVAYLFSKYMYNQIDTIGKGFSMAEDGNFDYQIANPSKDEIGRLAVSFNLMNTTIKKSIQERYGEKIARQDAEVKYLQAQMNPHFIYNTLQIISSMAVVMKVPEINRVSKNLAKILRYRIGSKSSFITIKEELNIVKAYLDIQKLRFKEFMTYEIEIRDEVLDFKVLKLMVQPIIENAVVHGIEPKGVDGKISIGIEMVDEELIISVRDNGRGMTQEKLQALARNIDKRGIELINDETNDNHNNVGLRNINQRIKLVFGERYGMKVTSKKGEWTQVVIRIPALKEGVSNDI